MGFLPPPPIRGLRVAAPSRQLTFLAIFTLGLAAAPLTSWGQVIDGGNEHSLAIDTNGNVTAWGTGHGSPSGQASAVAGGMDFSLVLRPDGSIEGWGTGINMSGAPTGTGFTGIAAGGGHGLAVSSSGSVEAWGANDSGQANPPTLTPAAAVAAGQQHSVALLSNGNVAAWGNNINGQVDPTNPGASTAENTQLFSNAAAISAGGTHSLALRRDGTLGSGTFAGEYSTTGGPAGAPTLNAGNVVSIASGTDHSLALLSDGTVQAWGRDDSGQGSVSTVLADQFAAGGGVVAIGAGGDHSMAVLRDGSVVSWGDAPSGAPSITVPTTAEWASASDGNYLESYRWTHGTPSTVAADTLFNATGSEYTVSFQTDAFAANLSIEAGEVTFALGGNAYTIANTLTISNGASFTTTDGSLQAATMTNDGLLTNNVGATLTAPSFTNTGDLTNNGLIVGNVTVQDGGEISGTGTVQGNLTIAEGGTISPGNSIGTVDVDGNLILAEGGSYDWQITNLTGMAGDDWDLVEVTGSLDFNSLTSDNPFLISLTTLNDLDGFDPFEDYQWTIISATSTVGTFDSSHFSIDSSGFLAGELKGSFWLSMDGSNLMLNHAAIPEPSSILFALMGTGAGAFYMRRKRKQAADETAEETPAIA